MNVLLAKILSLIGIFIFSVLFGIAPIYLINFLRSPKVRWVNSAIISFSGGTLLGITFLHLMPEMRESYNKLMDHGHFKSFPHDRLSMVDTIICAGFFFIYILDELIHLLLERLGSESSHQPHGRNLAVGDSSYVTKSNPTKKDEQTSTDDLEITAPSTHASVHVPGILTIIALSFHDIFEGLALGIQEHNLDVLFIFLSVATHKYAIAFAVSLDFVLSGVNSKMVVIYTVCFSIVNPFGIALGIVTNVLSETEHNETPTTIFMQGISSGSLIYVTCFEVLQRHTSEEGHHPNGGHLEGIRNTMFVILGYATVLGLKIILPHSHGFEHEHGPK